MPPKQIPPNPAAINPATAAVIAAVTASVKKPPIKKKSSTGSTDSTKPTVKKKKTTAKAAKPGTTNITAVSKAKDDKQKVPPKVVTAATGAVAANESPLASSNDPTDKSSTATKVKAKATPQHVKAQKARDAKRELANFDSIEQAFRQDREVWCAPSEPSRGWMYRTGAAAQGGDSYIRAVNGKERPKGGVIFDETVLLRNALQYNNLTVDSLTPSAYTALLEQARRYALELLVDARDYAQHASRSTVSALTPADITLAAEMRGDMNGIPSTLPKFEDMADYACEMNKTPLPPIPSDCYNGVALPPESEQLTFRTFDVVNGARTVQKMMAGGDLPLSTVDVGLTKRSSNMDPILISQGDSSSKKGSNTQEKTSYGAEKGRQIAIHLKGGSVSSEAAKKGAAETAKPALTKTDSKNKRKLTEL